MERVSVTEYMHIFEPRDEVEMKMARMLAIKLLYEGYIKLEEVPSKDGSWRYVTAEIKTMKWEGKK